METQTGLDRSEVGGVGYISGDGSTYYAEAVAGKTVEYKDLFEFFKKVSENNANGIVSPEMPFSINVGKSNDQDALERWKTSMNVDHGGSQINYTWHSHPLILVYEFKDGENTKYSLTKPIFTSDYTTHTLGGNNGFANSEPSEIDMNCRGTYNNFVISKSAGEVTNHVYNRETNATITTTMNLNMVYNTQAKSKPNDIE